MTAPNNKPLTHEQLIRFSRYYESNPTWGPLHIVLEDGNVKDSDVQYCIEAAERKGDKEGAELAKILLTQSKSQRLSLPDKVTRIW
jgi:hypothetical protein